MLIFLPIVLLLLVLAVLGFLARYRPDYRSFWLINLSGPLLAWLSLLFLWAELPLHQSMNYWHLSSGPNFDLLFLLDAISWPLLFGVVSLLVAAYLSNVRQLSERNVASWLPGTAIAASSMLAVIAGNLLTLLMAWMFLDLLALAYHLSVDKEPASVKGSINSFAATLFGNILLLWTIAAYSGPSGLPIDQLPADTVFLLILAAGVRLAILPLNPFVLERSSSSRSSSVHIRLAQVAASLAILVRIDLPLAKFALPLTGLVLLATLYGSLKHLLATSGDTALSYWTVTLAGFVLVAAINGQSTAALAWSLTLIMGGTYLVLSESQPFNRWVTLFWGVALLSALPFLSNFAGSDIFMFSGSISSYVFFFPASLMIVAWIRRAQTPSRESVILERWEAILFRSGMALLLLSHFAIGLSLAPTLKLSPTLISAWPSLAILALAGSLWIPTRRFNQLAPKKAANLEQVLSLRWIYRWGGFILRQLAALLRSAGALLEGRAGVLWALLLVALLLSLITQLNPS
jgi:hypothetical protein